VDGMNFGQLTGFKLMAVLVLVAGLGSGALYYTVFKSQREQNDAARQTLQNKLRENAELEAYRPKLADMERQLANLKQQLEIERRIVPDEKEVDGLMRSVAAEARKSGIEVRRYTSRPYNTKDFYTEVPFEIEMDGPFYSMVGFFDRVAKLERIVNVSNLLVASTKRPTDAKAKKTYQYAANESVVATCVATTYFSHDIDPNGTPAAGAKTGNKAVVTPVAQTQPQMRAIR
jgi:type IV pilus assembly protein PilO